jgi:daunorubicin resistance ABC transporter ATP-binding subunit
MSEVSKAIFVSALKKSYQNKEVLKNVTFSVPKGKIYTLLGSNGAGKTTTIRILTTQIKADSGKIEIGGYDISTDPQKVHEIISLTGQFSAVDNTLTGKENLVIMGQLHHIPNPQKKAEELLEYFELSNSANQVVSTYSGGMTRKLDIAMSLVGNPKVIFLDEPTTGLDPQSRHNMWNIIQELNRSGITIFLTTQYLEEAEHLSDMIAILNKGLIIAEGTPTELRACLPHGIEFILKDTKNLEMANSLLKDYKTSITHEENKLTVFTDSDTDALSEIFYNLIKNKIAIQDFSKLTPSLEDVFLKIIKMNDEVYNENKF